MRDLRGHVVLLDFFTYCCVNCMHVQPVLRMIRERFSNDPVVAVGVHSGKFDAENDPARVRAAVARYEIYHPVVVDNELAIWNRYAVRSWPTLIVIRPDGTIAAHAAGEPDPAMLVGLIERELSEGRKKGTLAKHPIDFGSATLQFEGALRFPGKVSANPNGRIAISDSGHHRVLLTAQDGVVEEVIGSGVAGLRTGSFEETVLEDPQGTLWLGDKLLIADARAHVIISADLMNRTTEIVAGTGELGTHPLKDPAAARTTALRSPWSLALAPGSSTRVLVAMAGTHQICVLDLSKETIGAFAGTGVEARVDGPRLESAWAQPSEITSFQDSLYVADSETSALRRIDSRGHVSTIVGEGLFDFGDQDGALSTARLQHCLGVVATTDGLFVADTYNGKLKRIDFHRGEIATVLSDLSEPGGLAALPDGTIFIADTNAHRVVRYDGNGVASINVRGAPAPILGELPRPTVRGSKDGASWFTQVIEPESVSPLRGGVCRLRFHLIDHLAPESPLSIDAEVSRRSDLVLLPEPHVLTRANGKKDRIDLTLNVVATEADVSSELVVRIACVICEEGGDVCTPHTILVRVPLRVSAAGSDHADVHVQAGRALGAA